MAELVVVVPVYNEQESLAQVIDEWMPFLRKSQAKFEILIVDDGSTDETPLAISDLQIKYPEVKSTHHENRGHGLSCVRGYELAIQQGAEWILQIDSDGQCDPKYFEKFWTARSQHKLIFGTRRLRLDGFRRWCISWCVIAVVGQKTGQWIRDPNVPYRLMHREVLVKALPNVSRSIYLTNIAVSVELSRLEKIFWIPIVFRKRFGGQPKLKLGQIVKHGLKLRSQLL